MFYLATSGPLYMCDRVDTARQSMFCVPVEYTVYFNTDSFLDLIFFEGNIYATLHYIKLTM